jgi:glutathione S-transferase
VSARLLGVPGSHAVLAAELMLRHRGIAYRRIDVPNGLHRRIVGTVPVLWLDGERIQTTRAIAARLGLSDGAAEVWADETLQDCVRVLGRWAAKNDPSSHWSFAAGSHLPVPKLVLRPIVPVLGRALFARVQIPADAVRARLQELPSHLDHCDDLIAQGVIGGEKPNAADFQVAASVRLATLFDDLRDAIVERPVGRLALRLAPDYPGRFAPVFPAAWLSAQERSSPR